MNFKSLCYNWFWSGMYSQVAHLEGNVGEETVLISFSLARLHVLLMCSKVLLSISINNVSTFRTIPIHHHKYDANSASINKAENTRQHHGLESLPVPLSRVARRHACVRFDLARSGQRGNDEP